MRPQDVLDPERISQLAAVLLAGAMAGGASLSTSGAQMSHQAMWAVRLARLVRTAAFADDRDWSLADAVKKGDTGGYATDSRSGMVRDPSRPESSTE